MSRQNLRQNFFSGKNLFCLIGVGKPFLKALPLVSLATSAPEKKAIEDIFSSYSRKVVVNVSTSLSDGDTA